MIEPLHVLLIGPEGLDPHPVTEALTRIGLEPRVRTVHTRSALAGALAERSRDLYAVVGGSDELPPLETVARIRLRWPECPVFVLGAAIEEAGDLFRAGATDLLPPDAWTRLAVDAARAVQGRIRADAEPPEAAFLAIAGRMPVGLYRTTSDGRLLYANPALARMLGCDDVDELLGLDVASDYAYPRDQFLKAIAGSDRVEGFETTWTREDGSTIVTRETARAVRDEDGELLYYEGTIQDVSAERAALRHEQRRAAQLEAIVRYGTFLDATHEAAAIYRATVETTQTVLGAAGAVLLLPQEGALEAVAWTDGLDARVVRMLAAFAMDQSDGSREGRLSGPALRRAGIERYQRFQLQYAGRRVAVLLAVFDGEQPAAPVDTAVGEALAWHAASALARRAAEQAVNESKSALHSISLATGLVLYRRRFESPLYDHLSDSVATLTGFSPRDVQAMGGLSALIRETRVTEGDLRFESERRYSALHLLRTSSGRLIWVEDRAHPWLDENGDAIGLVGVLQDVTERQRREEAEARAHAEALAQQSALLELSARDASPAKFMREAVEVAARVTGTDRVSLWRIQNGHAHCQALYHLHREAHGQASVVPLVELEDKLDRLMEQRTVAISDVVAWNAESALLDAHFVAYDIQAVLVAPIVRHGALAGLALFEHCGTPRDWTHAERDFSASLAGLVALSIERGERGRAEQALRQSERRYRAVSELASDYAYGVRYHEDGTSTIDWATRAFERITGYDIMRLAEPLDIIRAVVHPEDQERVLAELEQAAQGRIVEFDVRLVTRSGDVRWVRHRSAPVLDRRGRLTYVYATGQDVTERVHSKQALRVARDRAEQALAEAQEARETAEEMARLKGAFLANMSHEIRTPLTGIIGFAEVLAEEVGEDQREFAELIAGSGRRLLDTLNSVLDLARLEGGDVRVEHTELDVVVEAQQVCDLFVAQAAVKNLAIAVDAEGPMTARLDRACLGRILTNLVGNAVKFTERGGVTVRVRPRRERVEIRVEDTGIGMDEAFLPMVFDEFKQESEGPDRKHEGSGLGMTITRRLVDLLGGTISVESRRGHGTTFTVLLPRHIGVSLDEAMPEPDAPEVADALPVTRSPLAFFDDDETGDPLDAPASPLSDGAALGEALLTLEWEDDFWADDPADEAPSVEPLAPELAEDALSVPGDGAPLPVPEPPASAAPAERLPDEPVAPERPALPRLLLVEDNPDTRLLIERLLEDAYAVEAVAEARVALDRLSHQTYDVLVLDIHLGGRQTGADVLRVARTIPGCEAVPAVALTAYALPGDRERFLAEGFDAYVSKPFTRTALVTAIARVRAARPTGV